jgi:hypothetical protein
MKNLAITLLITIISFISAQASAIPAIVVKEFECTGFIPDPETGVPIFPLFTTETQGVAVVGKVGKISCHFDHDYPLERASASTDFVCAVPSPVTGELLVADRQLMLATPGGKALLECKFGPAKGEPQPPVLP